MTTAAKKTTTLGRRQAGDLERVVDPGEQPKVRLADCCALVRVIAVAVECSEQRRVIPGHCAPFWTSWPLQPLPWGRPRRRQPSTIEHKRT
jgi:hypothetical protein